MAKDSQRLEQEFIAAAREKTGHTVGEWMTIIRDAGIESKNNTILKWLKDTHHLNHLQANFLTGIYLNDGKPVYDYAVLFQKLFEGKDNLKPIYQALEQRVGEQYDDVDFIPTRNYVSIEGKRCFACATLMKDRIRVGLDLGDTPVGDYVQKAKGLGAMPNLTHMVEISAIDDVNDKLMGYFQQAYDRVHRK